jgi:hypothetical protein
VSGLRIRRYLDGELVDTRQTYDPLGTELLGEADANWCDAATEAGMRWRVIVDDPTGERLAAVILEGPL